MCVCLCFPRNKRDDMGVMASRFDDTRSGRTSSGLASSWLKAEQCLLLNDALAAPGCELLCMLLGMCNACNSHKIMRRLGQREAGAIFSRLST